MRQNKCRSCGAALLWATTEAGRTMPLDAEPTPTGDFVIYGATAVKIPRGGTADPPRYTSHFVTCPNAAQHRRKHK